MKELRFATLMRGSTNKQTAEGKKKKQARTGKKSARAIEDKDSLPEQKRNITRFVDSQPEESKGIKWIDSGLEFVEAGVSAFHTHTSKRKGLQDAYESAKKGEYDILVLYKLDRFGRRSVESLDMALKFLKHCRIWVVDKGVEFKNTGEYDEIMNFLEFWNAKKSSQDTKKRVTDAMKNIAEDGYWTGGNPPYGFENHPELIQMLKEVPSESTIVKEIYDLYVNHGFGYLKVASHLNSKGLKSRTGVDWSAHTVRKILTNTIYKGYLSYGKTKVVEGEFGSYQKSLKNGEGTISTTYWEAYDIVGEEMWERAQQAREKRVKPNAFGNKIPSNKATGKGLLVGVLKCECGGHMTYSTCSDWADSKRTKKKEPYGIYRCQTRLKKGVAVCGAKKATYRTAELDARIIKELSQYTSKLLQENHIEKIREKTETATTNIKAKMESVKEDIVRYTKLKDSATEKLMKLMMGTEIGSNENQMNEIYKTAEAKLIELQKQLDEFESLQTTDNMNDIDIMKLEDYIANWEFIFNHGTLEQKRNLILSIINEVQVTKDEITISTELDIPKFFEEIVAIKETAKEEIAVSLETLAHQGNEDSNPYLQLVDSRSTDSTHNTSMEYLSTMYSSDTDSKQKTSVESFKKKLFKAFNDKLKNKMIIGA
jgi:site-specific DNA recombinase